MEVILLELQLKVLQIHARICLYAVQRTFQQKNAKNATVPVVIVQLYHVVSYLALFRFKCHALQTKHLQHWLGSVR